MPENAKIYGRFYKKRPYTCFLFLLFKTHTDVQTMLSDLSDHIAHLIPARFFSFQEFGCLNRTFGEQSFGISGVLECDHFIIAGKDHIMFSDDGSTADSRDSNLFVISLFSSLTSIESIMVSVVQSLVQTVCQGQGGSA